MLLEFALSLVSGIILIYIGILISRKRKVKRPHNIRSKFFGISFTQDSSLLPIFYYDDHVEIVLKAHEFNINFPRALWKSDADSFAYIAVHSSKELWRDFEHRSFQPKTFVDGMGMADYAFGSGTLMLSTYSDDASLQFTSFNAIGGGRFNNNSETELGVFVSAITDSDNDINLIAKNKRFYLIVKIVHENGVQSDKHENISLLFK